MTRGVAGEKSVKEAENAMKSIMKIVMNVVEPVAAGRK